MGLLNGLSALGAGVAAFAGTAGLENQKAELAKQSMILADQLATTRESAGRQEAGAIAATAAEKQQTFLAGESGLQRTSAEGIAKLGADTSRDVAGIGASATRYSADTQSAASRYSADTTAAAQREVAGIQGRTSLGVAGIGADSSKYSVDSQAKVSKYIADLNAGTSLNVAGVQAASSKYSADLQSQGLYAQIAAVAPTRAAEILQMAQKTALDAVLAQNAGDLRTAHKALQEESGKETPDPGKIAALKNQVTTLETSAGTEAATTQAAAAMYRTDMDSVQHYNTQLVTATAALNQMAMGDADREAQKGLVTNLQTQLTGAQRALQYSSDLMHGRVGTAAGSGQPGVPPPPPTGVPPGSRYSPSLKLWQTPTGDLFDPQGNPAMAPGQAGPPPPRGFINNGAGARP